ncbi:MAG: hypothetical protein U0746_00420 [Gemmataceae bacterium]
MTMREIATWAGVLVASTSLTGCTSSGSNFTRPNPTATPKVASGPKVSAPTPVAAQPTAPATPTASNGSAWANNAPTNRANAGNGPIPITPNGTTPAMTNMPASGISQTGGIAPPPPPALGTPVSANPQPVVPAAVLPANGTVSEAQKPPIPVAAKPADETLPVITPPMPSMQMPLPLPQAPTGLSPAPVVLSSLPPPPPIKVRQ